MNTPDPPTVLMVPGLRDHVESHWQTLMAARLTKVQGVPPMGRTDLNCKARVQAIERAIGSIDGLVVLVAHSAGCVMVAHWATSTRHASRVRGCLLATPPDFERPMPDGYPTLQALELGGWLPVPRSHLPFRSVVAASRDDPLGSFDRVQSLARDWGSELDDLGRVGHLNPAYGFGPWPRGAALVSALSTGSSLP